MGIRGGLFLLNATMAQTHIANATRNIKPFHVTTASLPFQGVSHPMCRARSVCSKLCRIMEQGEDPYQLWLKGVTDSTPSWPLRLRPLFRRLPAFGPPRRTDQEKAKPIVATRMAGVGRVGVEE